MTSTREGRVYVPPTGANDVGLPPVPDQFRWGSLKWPYPGEFGWPSGVARAELPGTVASTAKRKPSGVADGHRPQAPAARCPLRRERRDTVKGTARRPTPSQHCLLASGARRPARAEGIRDQSRMAAIRHEARGAAREPDGGTPRRPGQTCLRSMCVYVFITAWHSKGDGERGEHALIKRHISPCG